MTYDLVGKRVFCRSCGTHVYDIDWPGHFPRASAEDLRDVGYGVPEPAE